MREIVLDTETTGFDPATGDRIVEIGALELINHIPTGESFHVYINPERAMPQSAFEVHGLGDDFLKDQPLFDAVADDFMVFIASDPLIIHNASFDMKFLNAELKKSGRPIITENEVIDTLMIARRKFPGGRNSLDELCRKYNVDNSGRTLHGALLDSELLAEVYIELIEARQTGLDLNQNISVQSGATKIEKIAYSVDMKSLITAEEQENHDAFIKTRIGDKALWNL